MEGPYVGCAPFEVGFHLFLSAGAKAVDKDKAHCGVLWYGLVMVSSGRGDVSEFAKMKRKYKA